MSLPSWAVPGAPVICVYDEDSLMQTASGERRRISEMGIFLPLKGVTYTLRGVTQCGCGVYLAGIGNPVSANGVEVGYMPGRFAPVAAQKTQAEDVAMMKALIGIETEERA